MVETPVIVPLGGTAKSTPRADTGWAHQGALTLVGILAIAAVLRFALADYSLWFDEYASLFFAHQPLARLWSDWMLRETNPPLYYSILHEWMVLIGPMDRVMLRYPSILASLLTIMAVYLGIKRAFGGKAAAMGAMMLAVSAQQIAYSHQIRGFSFFALAISISFLGLVWLVTANERGERQPLWPWGCYVGGSVAAIYLHTTGFLWLPIATLCLMAVDRSFLPLVGRYWLRLALADLLIVLGSCWALFIVYSQMREPNLNIAWLERPGIKHGLSLFWTSNLLAENPYWIQAFPAAAILSAAVAGFVFNAKSATAKLAAICWFVAFLTFFLISYKQPVIVERTIVWFALFPTYLAASLIGTITQRSRSIVIAILLVGMLSWNLAASRHRFQSEDWDQAVALVSKDPDGALIVRGEGHALIANEACKLATKRQTCAFPIIALAGVRNNVWASGYGPTIEATASGTLALPSRTDLYILVRHSESPLRDLKAAGLFSDVASNDGFISGPYKPPHVSELIAHGCVRQKLLELNC